MWRENDGTIVLFLTPCGLEGGQIQLTPHLKTLARTPTDTRTARIREDPTAKQLAIQTKLVHTWL